MSDRIQFELGRDEALVLYELLADFDRQSSLTIPSTADRLALLRLHGAIERTIPEVFSFNYAELLAEAKKQLSAEYGETE